MDQALAALVVQGVMLVVVELSLAALLVPEVLAVLVVPLAVQLEVVQVEVKVVAESEDVVGGSLGRGCSWGN